MSKRTTDMTVGSPTKHILGLSVPLIFTNVGQRLYMIADSFGKEKQQNNTVRRRHAERNRAKPGTWRGAGNQIRTLLLF